MRIRPFFLAVFFLSALNLAPSTCFAQGDLNPPGPPGPIFKTLEQIEPRTAIGSLPFDISTPGSYYLTTNLTGGSGITIHTSDATLDLNGFTLSGGTGSGISVVSIRTNICIRNGTVRGWSGNGIDASTCHNSQFTDLRISKNGIFGLTVFDNCLISRCSARANGDNGIDANNSSSINACTTDFNGGAGIAVGQSSVVRDCTATGNTKGLVAGPGCALQSCVAGANSGGGFDVSNACVLAGCVAYLNAGTGVIARASATITGCTATSNSLVGIFVGSSGANPGQSTSLIKDCISQFNGLIGIATENDCQINGCMAGNNRGDGIQFGNHCLIVNNVCNNNRNGTNAAGIHCVLGLDSRIDGNLAVQNERGFVLESLENLIIRNSSIANLVSNWAITPGNYLGNTNSIPGGVITDNNPWRNFTQ